MPFPRIALPSSTDATSRCFRTDADGRIPLGREWPALFRELTRFDAVALQCRHACARLIHFGSLPELHWTPAGDNAHDDRGALHLRCAHWGETWGRIAPCSCCGSPGRIEISNTHGAPFLEICSAPDESPARWADCLSELVASPPAHRATTPRALGFNLVPDQLRTVADGGEPLGVLFSALEHARVPLRVLLRTPEVTHLRAFTPENVILDQQLLTVTGDRTTLQLALPAVRTLHLAPDRSLHVGGPGRTLLLSLAPADGESPRWFSALDALFEI